MKAFFDVEEFARVVEFFFRRPQFPDHLHPFVGVGVARIMVHCFEPEHAQLLRIPAAHHVQRETPAGQMVNSGALLGRDDRVDGWYVGLAEYRGVVCQRAYPGGPGQRLVAGAIEIGCAAETLPTRHRHHRLEARAVGEGDDVAAVRPVHHEMAWRRGRGAAIADIGTENAKLQPVVAIKRVEAAAVGAHSIPSTHARRFRTFPRFTGHGGIVALFGFDGNTGCPLACHDAFRRHAPSWVVETARWGLNFD
jgi:hypothetical protein